MRTYLRYTTAALLAVLMCLTVAQSRQGGMMGFGTGPGALVNSKTVLADIKATDEQKEKLKEWAKEFQTKQFGMFKDLKEASKEERAEKMVEFTKETWKQLGGVLKDDQVKRLKQIEIQVGGPFAVMRADVSEALKITDDQKGKITAAGRSMFEDLQAVREEFGLKGFGGGKLEDDKQKSYDKKVASLNKEFTRAFEDALTDDQKKKWKDMTGAPIDVAKVQAESRPQFGGFGKKKD